MQWHIIPHYMHLRSSPAIKYVNTRLFRSKVVLWPGVTWFANDLAQHVPCLLAMENHRKQGHDAMVHSTGRYYSTSALWWNYANIHLLFTKPGSFEIWAARKWSSTGDTLPLLHVVPKKQSSWAKLTSSSVRCVDKIPKRNPYCLATLKKA